MAIRLYSEFKSDNGTQYKIEIHDASWVAAATTFNVDSRGFDLIYEGETDDIVSPIVSSRLTFGAYSENATFETFINTLKTFQENRFQLAVRKYNGASYDLYWAGWITQDLVSVEDESQPYIYEITATDGIGRLSNIDYTTANTISQANGFKATDIIAILKTAFVNIGTSDLWGAGDAFFETSVDWWETNYQTYATSTDPISQHAVDVRLFNEFDDDGNVVYSSTLDILRQIATLYNGRFYMQNGRFVFEQYGNRDTASRYVSRYTKAGTHLGRVLVSDDKTIDQTANAARRSGNGWDFLPATQTAMVHYVQKFLNPFNAFGLFRFRNSTNAYTAGFIAGGSGIQLSIGSTSFNFKVTGSASLTSPIFPVFKMRIRIQDSSTGTYYYYNRSYNGVAAGGAMFGTPAWSTTSGFYYFDLPPFFTSGVSVVNQPVSIITDDMPVNGELDFQLTLHGVFRSKNGTTYTPSTTPLFDSIFVFGIQTNGSANAPGATFSSNNTTTGIDSKLTLDLGDLFIADGPRQTGHLAVFTGADWVGTSDWRKGSSGASLPILKLLTNETLALHVNPIEQYNGNVITSTLFGQRLVFNSAAYLMTGGTFNASSDEWSGTWYKIESVRANVTALTPVSDLVQKATIATATTSGSSSNDIIGGRIGGMVVDIEDQKIGPFQQTASGARLVGNTEITGTLDVDGAAQFNNDVNITGSVTSTGPLTGEYVQLDTTYNTTPIQGQIVWSQDDGTIDVGLNSNVTMQVGQEQFWFVKNQTGSTIPKGTAVRAAGTLGASGRILAAPMVADGSVPARFFLGLAAENITNGSEGYVTTFGNIRGINTTAFAEGSVLWCNPAVAGGLTATEPSAPNLKLAVAFVLHSGTNGTIAVRSEIGARVSDASDVQITSVADNDLLQYNTATSRWENVAGTTTNIAEGTNLYYTNARSRAALSAGVGISYNNGTGVITNSAPDQVVAVTAGTGISVTGTYPNFTITNTSPSSGGTITGGGTTNYLSKWTGASALGNSLVFDNGTSVGINQTSPIMKLHISDVGANIVGGNAISTSTMKGVMIQNTNNGDESVGVWFNTGGSHWSGISGQRTSSATNWATDLRFYTHEAAFNDLTYARERVRIDSEGNVGIGTSTPTAKLDVSGNVRASAAFISQGGNNSWTGAAIFMDWQNTYGRFGAYNYATSAWMPISLNDGSIYITGANGNVGIGTTAPGAKLEVVSGSTPFIRTRFNASYYTDFDTNGIDFRGPAQTFDFKDNGSSVVRIASGGNVGIGTTAPSSKLHVEGAGLIATIKNSSAGADEYSQLEFAAGNRRGYIWLGNENTSSWAGAGGLNIYTSSGNMDLWTSGVQRVRIDTSGNVGIGTTAPSTKLHVAGDGRFEGNVGIGHGSAAEYFLEIGQGRTGNGFAYIDLIGDATYTDYGLRIIRNNGGSNTPSSINHRGLGTFSLNAEDAAPISFLTSSSERMRITAAGNVGIGTTAPGALLQVGYQNGTTDALIRLGVSYAGDRTSRGGITWHDSANTTGKIYTEYDGTMVSMVFGSLYNSGYNSNNLMIIRGNGNVGIGTTNPTQLLQVAGNEVTASKINAVGTIYGSGAFLNAFSSAGGNDVGFAGFIASQANQTNRMWTGVHSPSGANQAFIGTPDSMPLAFWTNSAEQMRITSAGNVGIGTTSPGAKLEVNGNIKLSSTAGATATPSFIWLGNDYSNGTTRDKLKIYLYNSGPEQYGFSVGSIGDVQYHSNAIHDFYIANGNALRINSSGLVGIGTTSPTEKLHVDGNAVLTYNNSYQGINSIGNKAILARVSPTTGIINYAEYATATNLNGFVMGSTATQLKGIFATNKLEFTTNSSTRMTITSGGLVGIGTTSPSHILHITDVMRMDNVSAYSPNLTSDSFAKHGYGDVSNDRYLAEPAIWFKINVDGTEYVIPGYTEVI